MKWGRTYEQIKQERDAWIEKMDQWHDWFAWTPVSLQSGQAVWLETIERRGYLTTYNQLWWKYREKE